MSIKARLRAVEKALAGAAGSAAPAAAGRYAGDPVRYAREVLGVTLWDKQVEFVEAIHKPPYRVLGRSSHAVGKTFSEAVLVNYWFDTYNPGCVITTAPTARDVRDLLWAEVRLLRQRAGLGGFRGEQAPELYDGPDHYAKGFTAARGESFQGRHPERMLILFDEATGVDATFWATARTMFDPGGKHAWACMFNPTDTSSQAHAEERRVGPDGRPAWHVVEVSSLDHPNIRASLEGRPEPFPGAVSRAQFEDWLSAWSDPLGPGDEHLPTDLEWPPGSGCWFRPGPLMEGRALGRYPTGATFGVWSERAWALVMAAAAPSDLGATPEIGCDVARHGDDYTAIHSRWGHRSVSHERHNGWEYRQTAARLRALCDDLALRVNQARSKSHAWKGRHLQARSIPVKVDADAYGWGVIENAEGYNFVAVPASGSALRPMSYPNRRSELWFGTVELAKAGKVCLADLPQEHQQRIRQQFFAPLWQPVGGLQVVEKKDVTKKRLGCSPDDADAVNLAYAEVGGSSAVPIALGERPAVLGRR